MFIVSGRSQRGQMAFRGRVPHKDQIKAIKYMFKSFGSVFPLAFNPINTSGGVGIPLPALLTLHNFQLQMPRENVFFFFQKICFTHSKSFMTTLYFNKILKNPSGNNFSIFRVPFKRSYFREFYRTPPAYCRNSLNYLALFVECKQTPQRDYYVEFSLA